MTEKSNDRVIRAARALADALEQAEAESGRTSHVEIPGTVYATYEGSVDEGTITRLVFTPFASAAGYFGPAAIANEAPNGLDTECPDGPFWVAIQTYLAASCTADTLDSGMIPVIGWTE